MCLANGTLYWNCQNDVDCSNVCYVYVQRAICVSMALAGPSALVTWCVSDALCSAHLYDALCSAHAMHYALHTYISYIYMYEIDPIAAALVALLEQEE